MDSEKVETLPASRRPCWPTALLSGGADEGSSGDAYIWDKFDQYFINAVAIATSLWKDRAHRLAVSNL